MIRAVYTQLATISINSPLPKTNDNLIEKIMYLVFGARGGVSIIIVVWAGMKYSLSAGDPAKTAEAKNQIMYAAIGIAVALSASSVVGYVSGRL